MKTEQTFSIIARIHSDFPTKFGIPRQSGLVPSLSASIVFESDFRNAEAVRGLENFSHLWLIWGFSETDRQSWSPTVRPPRLGGNVRMGVFATRSPFRPNAIGLSSVKLEKIEFHSEKGPVIHISGGDLMDGTPIYDIKPYLSFTDCHSNALNGFADTVYNDHLQVVFPESLAEKLSFEQRLQLQAVLQQDPRPAYHDDCERVYGFSYAGFEIRFAVENDILTVCEVTKQKRTKNKTPKMLLKQ